MELSEKLNLGKLQKDRAHVGREFCLSPLSLNKLRQEAKKQLVGVTIRRLPNGWWVVERDPNWGKKIQALREKARREAATPQEQSRLFEQYVREAAEQLVRQTERQMRRTVRLLRKILSPRKSPRRPVRQRNVVATRSCSRQPRRSGRTRAPTASTGGEENSGDGDKSDSSSIGLIQRTQRGLDEVYFVKPFYFAIYTTQVGFAKFKAGRQGFAADLRAFVSPHKNTHLTEVYNQYALCEF